MSKRIEKGLLDRFFNGYLLGKRKLSKPMKYFYNRPAQDCR